MKVKSYTTKRAWLEQLAAPAPGAAVAAEKQPDPATEELNRVLSDVIRAQKLIVLTGLGTSLCVKDAAGVAKAPTMGDLWAAVQDEYARAGDAGRPTWPEVLEIARQPAGNTNIEELLSRCKTAEGFELGAKQVKIQQFIADAERIIRTKVDFIAATETLPLHEVFLRKLGRRSTRRESFFSRRRIRRPSFPATRRPRHRARVGGGLLSVRWRSTRKECHTSCPRPAFELVPLAGGDLGVVICPP